MPIPGTLEVRGWFITDHVVENFASRYGMGGTKEDIRDHIGSLLNSVSADSSMIYRFYSPVNKKNMEIFHIDHCGIHSYFLVNPSQRPPAVVTVYSVGQFRNFWNKLDEKHRFQGPDLYSEEIVDSLEEKEKEIKRLKSQLESQGKKLLSAQQIINALSCLARFFQTENS